MPDQIKLPFDPPVLEAKDDLNQAVEDAEIQIIAANVARLNEGSVHVFGYCHDVIIAVQDKEVSHIKIPDKFVNELIEKLAKWKREVDE